MTEDTDEMVTLARRSLRWGSVNLEVGVHGQWGPHPTRSPPKLLQGQSLSHFLILTRDFRDVLTAAGNKWCYFTRRKVVEERPRVSWTWSPAWEHHLTSWEPEFFHP